MVRHPAGPGNAPAVVSMGENARSGHVDPSTLPPITTAVSDQPYEDSKHLQIKERYGRLTLLLDCSQHGPFFMV